MKQAILSSPVFMKNAPVGPKTCPVLEVGDIAGVQP